MFSLFASAPEFFFVRANLGGGAILVGNSLYITIAEGPPKKRKCSLNAEIVFQNRGLFAQPGVITVPADMPLTEQYKSLIGVQKLARK